MEVVTHFHLLINFYSSFMTTINNIVLDIDSEYFFSQLHGDLQMKPGGYRYRSMFLPCSFVVSFKIYKIYIWKVLCPEYAQEGREGNKWYVLV
jgi:hypothetical protein